MLSPLSARRHTPARLTFIGVAVAGLALASCGTRTKLDAADPTTTAPASSTAVTDTISESSVPNTDAPTTTAVAEVSTTVAVTTTIPAETTTTVPAADPLLLRVDGFGAFDFGTPVDAVVAGIPAALGGFSSDVTQRFVDNGNGGLSSADDSDTVFVLPFSRQLCYSELCLTFGSTDAASLALVGWTYYPLATGGPLVLGLHDVNGVTIGSRASDFPAAIVVNPGGCYTDGTGTTPSGITLALRGGDFVITDAAGNQTPVVPDPTSVTVTSMEAGSNYGFLAGDC